MVRHQGTCIVCPHSCCHLGRALGPTSCTASLNGGGGQSPFPFLTSPFYPLLPLDSRCCQITGCSTRPEAATHCCFCCNSSYSTMDQKLCGSTLGWGSLLPRGSHSASLVCADLSPEPRIAGTGITVLFSKSTWGAHSPLFRKMQRKTNRA